jgi:hypothetical protein
MAGGAGVELVATGSDDGSVKIWEGGEEASKVPVATLEVGCPVTSVCWSADGQNIYVGAIDNEIHVCAAMFVVLETGTDGFEYRCTTYENKSKCIHLEDIPTHRLPSPSRRMETLFCRHRSLLRPLFTMFGHSHLKTLVCTASCMARQQGSRIPFFGVPGARMMEAKGSQSGVPTEWYAYGKLTRGQYSISSRDIKAQSLRLIFIPKSLSVSFSFSVLLSNA